MGIRMRVLPSSKGSIVVFIIKFLQYLFDSGGADVKVKLYEIIGCDLVELVQIDRDMVMVVDEEGKCKSVHGAFTFIGSGMVIAGTAIMLGGNGNRFKALPENLASFQMMTEWVEPADVPPPRQTIISIQ
jgi:hypothetical protein